MMTEEEMSLRLIHHEIVCRTGGLDRPDYDLAKRTLAGLRAYAEVDEHVRFA